MAESRCRPAEVLDSVLSWLSRRCGPNSTETLGQGVDLRGQQPRGGVGCWGMLTYMLLPYRLDLHVDLFEINVAGRPVLLDQDELQRVLDEIRQVQACWPEPKPAQLWAAIIRGLGRDPRSDHN